MEMPVPYGRPTLNNSPLDGTGLDFPCKLRAGVYDITQMNNWTAGEVQTIRFMGSAVHGGGSCQFSLSEDIEPTKSSQWKVVYSVVGGCPAHAEGNLKRGSESQVADTFEVVLPKELPSGRYTFAWTWFNKRGNREMYMNCAPITVRGGGSNAGFLGSLPDMFVANLPSSACSTIEEFDLAFPNPGNAVVTASQARPTTRLVGAGCASMTVLGSGAETARHDDVLSNSSPDQHSIYTLSRGLPAVTSSEIASTSWLSKAVVKALTVGQMTASKSQAPVAQATQKLVLQGSTSASGVAVGLPTVSEACIQCSSENDIVCIDRDQYGLCNLGCARPQPLAPGTVCTDGRILKRED